MVLPASNRQLLFELMYLLNETQMSTIVLNSWNSSVIVIAHWWLEVCNIIYWRLVECEKCYSLLTLQYFYLNETCVCDPESVCVFACSVSPVCDEFGCLTVADVWKSEQLRRSPGQRLMFQPVEGTLSQGKPTVHRRLCTVDLTVGFLLVVDDNHLAVSS